MFTAISLILALTTSIVPGTCLICDDPTDLTTGVCGLLSKDVERALLKDEGNLFRIRRAFFHSPTASPVLLKVVYNVTYGENFTMAVASKVPPCFSQHLNSTIELNQTNITLGWTSSGVYTMFHPAVLSVMQVQTPFAFLRIIHRTLIDQRSPQADTFLWDGSYDLPTLHLNLHITSLTCVPSQEMFESVLMDLNTLLKLYGGRQQVLDVAKNVEFIGFTLPATSVTSNIIPIGSDVIFVNLYSSILCILYAISICLLTVWYFMPSSPAKKLIDKVINDRPDLSLGIRITSSTALYIESITRLANSIVWTLNIQNSSGIVFGIWMPQINLLLVAIIHFSFVNFYVCYQKKKEEMQKRKQSSAEVGESRTDTGEQAKRRCCNCNAMSTELQIFCNMCATAFALFYMLFPTIILMFAFPTQIIIIFTFVTAYLFATTIIFASIIKLFKSGNKQDNDHSSQQNIQKSSLQIKLLKRTFIGLLFIISWLIILYLHVLAVLALYTLLIGRGSVINTGPLFLISLLPSALLSGGAWVVKRVALNDHESMDEESQDEEGKFKTKCSNYPLQKREQVLHEKKNATCTRNRTNGTYQHTLENSV